jgi:glycosyltransferase involved in cell wall biosynthesis
LDRESLRARRLQQRLYAASEELLAARSEQERIAATADVLRHSTIDFQRELHRADARLRALSDELEALKAKHRAMRRDGQRLQAELGQLTWRAEDRELALEEARTLFREERAMVDELSDEIRAALADLRRAEAGLGTGLGRAFVKVGNAVIRRRATDPLYSGMARLESLDHRLIRRQRPVLAPRPSRIGGGRRRVTVIAWEMGHNPVGRAHALAQMLSRSHDVEVIGPSFPRYGTEIWAPIRGSEIPLRAFPGRELPQFLDDAESAVKALRTELVFVSKPRMPSLLMGMLLKHLRGVQVVVDVDDRELSFFDATAGISLDELESRRGSPDFNLPFGESWTLACDDLIQGGDAVTVSSEVLRELYGGTVIPHARDERLLNPGIYDRDAIRAEAGYSPGDRVVLFAGTPRIHKGLTEIAEALEQLGDPRYKLCVVGSISDPSLKKTLAEFPPERVKLLEYRPWNEVARTTLIGDLVCLLQRPDSEISRYQTPAKLTEAMAMGVPVLARETPPLMPFARQGLIKLVGDAPLASCIAELLSDPVTASHQGQLGRHFFIEHLSYAAVAARLDGLIEELGDVSKDPPASWRRALDIARSSPRQADPFRPAKVRIPKLFPAPRHTWDVVFFWKQNDSWIYGRRSDMLMKYLAKSDRTRRLVHFDAPTTWDAVEHHRVRSRATPADQSAEIYPRVRRRALFAERHGKVRSHTFVARPEHDGAAWQRAFLPAGDEYLGFIDHMMRRAGLGKRPILFWVWPVNFEFPEIHTAFSPELTVADVVDDHRAWIKPGTPYYERLTENYQAVLSVSDVVLANCESVRERMSWFGADPLVVPNAMEIFGERAHAGRRPAELRHLSGQIIGYAGNLGSRIDLSLLDRLASECHDCQIVLIGSAHLSNEILELDRHPNVHFLGVRPYPEVVRYIRCFDVAIIPHRDDRLTRSMNPLKAYVYAGCGVPVVTTEIANLPDLAPAIRTASSHDEFLRVVAELLEEARRGDRSRTPRELLERHTWEQRVSQIERILDTAGESRELKTRGAVIPA